MDDSFRWLTAANSAISYRTAPWVSQDFPDVRQTVIELFSAGYKFNHGGPYATEAHHRIVVSLTVGALVSGM
jgi:hypothetical protein